MRRKSWLREIQKLPIVAKSRRYILQEVKKGRRLEEVCRELEEQGVPKNIIQSSLRLILWRLQRIAEKRGYM